MEATQQITTWLIDPVHSKIRFEAGYLQLTSISGWFREFEGHFISPAGDFAGGEIDLVIYTRSLFTGHNRRDEHLRSADFFHVQQFPLIRFHSTSIVRAGNRLEISGDLTIRDITRSVHFTATYAGDLDDDAGNRKAGFELHTTISRRDFGITWNKSFGLDSLLVADEVTISCDVELLKFPA